MRVEFDFTRLNRDVVAELLRSTGTTRLRLGVTSLCHFCVALTDASVTSLCWRSSVDHEISRRYKNFSNGTIPARFGVPLKSAYPNSAIPTQQHPEERNDVPPSATHTLQDFRKRHDLPAGRHTLKDFQGPLISYTLADFQGRR